VINVTDFNDADKLGRGKSQLYTPALGLSGGVDHTLWLNRRIR
jgi:hypothetical protein